MTLRRPILISVLHQFVIIFLLRNLPTYLQPWKPHGTP